MWRLFATRPCVVVVGIVAVSPTGVVRRRLNYSGHSPGRGPLACRNIRQDAYHLGARSADRARPATVTFRPRTVRGLVPNADSVCSRSQACGRHYAFGARDRPGFGCRRRPARVARCGAPDPGRTCGCAGVVGSWGEGLRADGSGAAARQTAMPRRSTSVMARRMVIGLTPSRVAACLRARPARDLANHGADIDKGGSARGSLTAARASSEHRSDPRTWG